MTPLVIENNNQSPFEQLHLKYIFGQIWTENIVRENNNQSPFEQLHLKNIFGQIILLGQKTGIQITYPQKTYTPIYGNPKKQLPQKRVTPFWFEKKLYNVNTNLSLS